MAKDQIGSLIDRLRGALLAGGKANLTDSQLLEDYLSRRDEAAVAALVRRHGPMVWGVCRRVLHNHHDAEDAFQATFLILVRKAASIMPREMIGNWLYGVAHQTALKARATTAKRHARESQMKELPEPAILSEPDLRADLQPLLDQELSRLPDRYRVAIVLCNLEGKTRKEAARQLQIPEGTLSSRLTTARRMLAKRLASHGLPASAAALAALLTKQVALATVTASPASSTIKAATLAAAGQGAVTGAISIKVAALTEGVMKTMLMSKLKAVIAVVLALGFMATGAAVLTCRLAAAQSDKPPIASGKPPTKKDGETAQAEKRSGYLQLGKVDVVKGIVKGDAVSTNDERTIYSHRQESWELMVGPTTKVIIDGKEAKLADLGTIKPEPGSSDGWLKLIFAEWEHEHTADKKDRINKGKAIRLEGKGAQVRGIIQAKNPGNNTLTFKRIHGGFSGDFVADTASEVSVAKDVHVTIDHNVAAFNGLKPGMKVTLRLSAVKNVVLGIKAYGAKVDGVLKAVDARNNTVSVNILSAQMTAERVSVVKDAKVVIDGQTRRLSDLKAGMRVTLQMSAEAEESLIVGVTKDKTGGED